jgi:hypothetical protein
MPLTPEDAGWSLGTDVDYLRELVADWVDGYDWPTQEAALARLPHFRVPLDDLGIHFVHARAVSPDGAPLPLILTHGWPDSFWRYSKVIPLLTDPGAYGADPADAFDVVVPDMPGFGYSDAPAGPPLDSIAVADLWARLMSILGYERFGAAAAKLGATSAATWRSIIPIASSRCTACMSGSRRGSSKSCVPGAIVTATSSARSRKTKS